MKLKRGGDKKSIQIYGLDGYDFSIKDCAAFLSKQLSIAATVSTADKGQRVINLVADVDNDDLEDTLNLFNPYIEMGKFIYEDQKLKVKEGAGGKKNHQGARDKKFKAEFAQ